MRTIGQKTKNTYTCFPRDFSKSLISFSALHFLSPTDSVLNDFVMMHCVFMPNTQLCPALVAQYPFTVKSLYSLQDTLHVHGHYLTPASEGKSWPRQSCAPPAETPALRGMILLCHVGGFLPHYWCKMGTTSLQEGGTG